MKKLNQIIFILCFLFIILFVGVHSWINVSCSLPEGDMTLKQRITDFEGAYKNNFYERREIVNFHGYTQRLIGNNIVEDSEVGAVVKTNYGQLTSLPDKNDLTEFKKSIKTINEACEKNDIEALYVQAPFKILPNREKSDLEAGMTTDVNENADSVLQMLKKNNRNYYDLRSDFEQCSSISPDKLFFDTDHHWTIRGAFFGFSKVLEYLHDEYDYCSDEVLEQMTNSDSFHKFTMEKCFLGAWGRRVGTGYANVEDFEYFVPNFYTNFHVYRVADDVDFEITSDFYNCIMNPKRVEKDKNHELTEEEKAAYYGDGIYTDLYSVYMDGYTNEMIVENTTIDSDKKVLIFHDSFGFPFSSFMCLTAGKTIAVDLRIFHKDIEEYIRDYDPDLVIMLYNPNQ